MTFNVLYLEEAVVERQVVAYRVLPALAILVVVGEALHDELVDAVEGDAVVWRVLDGHRDQGDVAVGRLLRVVVLLVQVLVVVVVVGGVW